MTAADYLAEAGPAAPRVSVVMSVYNDAGRVMRAVRSILDQTHTDLELIVVDDGSDDGSGEVLDRLAIQDSRLRVLHQSNSGLTRALIRGCAEARGEFIARQDSDDWSHPERISEQLLLFELDDNIGLVSCPTQFVGPNEEPLMVISRAIDSQRATFELREQRQGPPAHGSVIFRRALYERVGGYRWQFYFAQDSDLWLRMVEHASIAYLSCVRYVALREPESTSGVQRPVQRQFGELGQLCRLARREGAGEDELLARAAELADSVMKAKRSGGQSNSGQLADAAYFIGSQLVSNGDRRATRYLWRAIWLQPWSWKAWIRIVQTLFLRAERRNNLE